MGGNGFLIPDHFVAAPPNEVDMNTASIFFGFSLGLSLFAACTAGDQTWKSWKRSRRVTMYMFFVWVVWISCMVMAVLAWMFQRGYIKPSFWFFFNIALWWTFKMHCILQILINRIGLLMGVPGRATKIKWSVFVIILLINISVFVIWIPARLQINSTWIHINEIWDRCEKVIFAIIDTLLNGYFIFLVRTRLIDNGLTKYYPLYRINLLLIFVSLAMDIALIGLMSLPSSLVYLSFHPVAYLVKLHIEMRMADLITKIVKSTGLKGSDGKYDYSSTTGAKGKSTGTRKRTFRSNKDAQSGAEDNIELDYHSRSDEPNGILKTIETTVARVQKDVDEEDSESRSSSTRNLHYPGKL